MVTIEMPKCECPCDVCPHRVVVINENHYTIKLCAERAKLVKEEKNG